MERYHPGPCLPSPGKPKQSRRVAVDHVLAGASPAPGIPSCSAVSSALVWGTRGRECNSHQLDPRSRRPTAGHQRDELETEVRLLPGAYQPFPPRRIKAGRSEHFDHSSIIPLRLIGSTAERLVHIEETGVRLPHQPWPAHVAQAVEHLLGKEADRVQVSAWAFPAVRRVTAPPS